MNEITDQTLIRYITYRGKEVTGILTEEGEIYSVYWPYNDEYQPGENEKGVCQSSLVVAYSAFGWLSDEGLVSVHEPIKCLEQAEIWIMLYPEDRDFIITHYKHLFEVNNDKNNN